MLSLRIRRRFGRLPQVRAAFAATLALWVAAPVAAVEPVTEQMLLNASNDPNNWITAGRDYASTRYSPLTQITPDNVKRLVPKWSFSLGTLDAQQTTPL